MSHEMNDEIERNYVALKVLTFADTMGLFIYMGTSFNSLRPSDAYMHQ